MGQLAKHQTVGIYNPIYEVIINIDKEISELISLLWEIGLTTDNSCQENKPGIIWIEFPIYDAERFLNIICGDQLDRIYNDIRLSEDSTDWKFDVCFDDLSEFINENEEVEFEGPPYLCLSLSIRFPKKDYNEIYSRVKKWKDLYGSIDAYDNLDNNPPPNNSRS